METQMPYATSVVLDPKDIETMSFDLKKQRLDYYLFFELVYRTGTRGVNILNMSVAEMQEFCEKNKEYLSDLLQNSIKEHSIGKKKTDFFFSATRNPSQCLSKRTIENAIAKVALKYGYDNFGVKTLARTFLYEQLRLRGYSFEKFRQFLNERNRYFANVEDFISYCGLTPNEYRMDVKLHTMSSESLSADCDDIIKVFKSIKKQISSPNTTGDRYRELADIVTHVSVLTATVK